MYLLYVIEYNLKKSIMFFQNYYSTIFIIITFFFDCKHLNLIN